MRFTLPELQKLVTFYSSDLPKGAKDRIIVANGGLAYPLFGSYFSNLVILSTDERWRMGCVGLYNREVQDYIDDAEQHARGFNLVYIMSGDSGEKIISSDFDPKNVSQYKTGVGKIPILSARNVEKFCEMIKSGHEQFEDRYNRIKELAEKLGCL